MYSCLSSARSLQGHFNVLKFRDGLVALSLVLEGEVLSGNVPEDWVANPTIIKVSDLYGYDVGKLSNLLSRLDGRSLRHFSLVSVYNEKEAQAGIDSMLSWLATKILIE